MAEPYISIVERLVGIARGLNLTAILMIALLLMMAVPTYFAWRFLTDEAFRREFMQGAELLTDHAPCIVLEGHAYGQCHAPHGYGSVRTRWPFRESAWPTCVR